MKAGIVENVSDYEYSSWGEYDGMVESVFQILAFGFYMKESEVHKRPLTKVKQDVARQLGMI